VFRPAFTRFWNLQLPKNRKFLDLSKTLHRDTDLKQYSISVVFLRYAVLIPAWALINLTDVLSHCLQYLQAHTTISYLTFTVHSHSIFNNQLNAHFILNYFIVLCVFLNSLTYVSVWIQTIFRGSQTTIITRPYVRSIAYAVYITMSNHVICNITFYKHALK
jgi:hypothetical protein